MTAAHGTPPAYTLSQKPPARLAVFVSGGGSNMKAIHAAILDGRINAKIAVSACRRRRCVPGLQSSWGAHSCGHCSFWSVSSGRSA